MIWIRLHVAAIDTIAILVTKYLKMKALAIHFKTFWFTAVAADRLKLIDLLIFFALFYQDSRHRVCRNSHLWKFESLLHNGFLVNAVVTKFLANGEAFIFLQWLVAIFEIVLSRGKWALPGTEIVIIARRGHYAMKVKPWTRSFSMLLRVSIIIFNNAFILMQNGLENVGIRLLLTVLIDHQFVQKGIVYWRGILLNNLASHIVLQRFRGVSVVLRHYL